MISSSIGGGGLGVRGPFFLLWLLFEVLKIYKAIVRSLNISRIPPGYFKVLLKKTATFFSITCPFTMLYTNSQYAGEK